jgi:hypothetical protein
MGGVRGRGSPTIFFSFLDVIVEMFLSKTKRNKKEKVGDLTGLERKVSIIE